VIQALADGKVLAERFGSLPPAVVALHGWGRSGNDFAPIVAGLDAVAIHLPGFGPTSPPDTVWGTADYAELVAEAIRPFGPVVVVGHSFGGRIAVRLAARHPELVSSLVLTGAPLVRLAPTSKPELGYRLARALHKWGLITDARMKAIRSRFGSADYNAAQGIMREIMVATVNENYDDDMAALSLPVAMVWGENDTAAPTAAGQIASTRIKGATWQVVPGTAHMMEGELAAAVARAVRSSVEEAAS
jgi:pimeloyl-ACP methyl ester carboxylesterase